MSGIRSVAFAALAAATLAAWVSVVRAQGPQGRDYLSAQLRAQVEELQQSASSTATSAANLKERLDTLWPWINAYALTGGPMPVNATLQVATAYRALEALRLDGAQPSASALAAIDGLVHEFTIKDKQPGALGTVSLEVAGPAHVGAWTTIKQTYTVGEASLGPGARIMVAKQLQADGGVVQNSDPDGPHYLSASTSNREVRLGNTSFPWVGMHGGFRSPAPMPTFKVEEGTLDTGDTVTIVYGDRSAGSEGWRLQTFATDQAMLPIYIDLDGSGNFLTPRWPAFEIVGTGTEGVTAVAPSIVEPGEDFKLSIRWEDSNGNRATGAMPGAAVTLNGESFRTLDANGDALRVIEGIRLDEEGIYRFGVTSSDGRIKALSNPVWVRSDPPYRLYWGETHTHTGMAEGQGSIIRSYRFAREDARLDFLGLSEHDIWLDDLEWQTMSRAAESNTVPGEFVAFLGYEWTLRRQWGGHHNVFFRSPDAARVGAQIAPTLTGLYEGLRSKYSTKDVLIIPHAHQAGDWRTNDPEMETMIEIMSMHGTFEWFGNYYLRQGHQVGFLAASDDHRSRPGYSWTSSRQPNSSLSQFGGLAGVQAESKTADSIFDSLKRRNAYAVTDAQRIILEMDVNGTGMGTRSEYRDKRRLRAKVAGTSPIRRVAVVKNGATVYTSRPLSVSLSSDAQIVVGFASSSEPFFRDNPRGYRPWTGSLRVAGAKLVGMRTLHFDNQHKEWARISASDANTVQFSTGTRGQADTLLLKLEGASPSTTITFDLEAGQEWGKSPVPVRPTRKLAAKRFKVALSDLSDGFARRDLSDTVDRDAVTLELIGSNQPMEAEVDFADTGEMQRGDYYYVRVDQLDGARAYSSPVWVGGEPRR
ncbi:MAG: DUF3604 domain-containing protein [Acidobacteriia bacterium]|nr:DUF3604 domain-containing protein [Terriglobia bacterium]MYG03452.1 DUF3604 domain-containing protein [Terriglobia bacterium]MYK09386.1 DUF3604 domain-containing protein [Terriglobia bacterium]